MGFQFLTCGKIGKPLLHLLVILGVSFVEKGLIILHPRSVLHHLEFNLAKINFIDQAKAFAEQTKFEGEIYADPTHSSYEALRFVSGVSTTFTPRAGLKIIQSYMEGYRQDWKLSSEKDTVTRGGWQQGGILVAGPGKSNIVYLHKDKEAGDDPDIEDILKACCS
ncbi:thioredoxin-like protein AAED1, chloroplastic [Quillaja saponaria]|uniref:Thioredoxin-like protein AAED1, chloroplastic n=1 Tax=Quillaja saponaria TaxID=32244 RepID=A0AAD7Q8X4_QUISA|nr:thioredoxin-like protein AAED1, chloroplastic [Quillaja saponaria]